MLLPNGFTEQATGAKRERCRAAFLWAQSPLKGRTPSAEDLSITRQLIECGKILGINVLDHIIVGHNDTEDRVLVLSISYLEPTAVTGLNAAIG
jgi:hypothetical protein